MKDPIQRIYIHTPCRKFNIPNDSCSEAHYCSICNKTVTDFRKTNRHQLEQLMAQSDGPICGIFNTRQASSRSRLPKLLTGLLVALGLNFLSRDSYAQQADNLDSSNHKVSNEDLIVGTFEILPVYKHGGLDGMKRFFTEQVVYPDSLTESGRVIVECTIDTSGNVKNVKLIKGFNHAANKEAVRVCALLQFTPAYQNGKPIETNLLIPIRFDPPTAKKHSTH